MSSSDVIRGFSCFVTGTDTEVGKTLVAASLVYGLARQGLAVAAMKPVAAGTTIVAGQRRNEDVDTLLSQATVAAPLNWVVPYLFDEPIAPHIAARKSGITMHSQHIVHAYSQLRVTADAVVVEGAGGFCVPLSDTEDLADTARQLGLPVVLVVGLRLGCISHAVLTAEAIRARGLALCAWVANTIDADMPYRDENIQTLAQRLKAPYLGCIPRLKSPDPAEAATYLDFSCITGWPNAPAQL